MAKSTGALSLSLLFIFLLLLSFNSGGSMKFANGVEINQGGWCVGKPSASEAELEANIEFACNNNLVDCKVIQEDGPCFFPNTLINHASVVMNQYYAAMGRNSWNCDFTNSALIVVTDPSYGGCYYA